MNTHKLLNNRIKLSELLTIEYVRILITCICIMVITNKNKRNIHLFITIDCFCFKKTLEKILII